MDRLRRIGKRSQAGAEDEAVPEPVESPAEAPQPEPVAVEAQDASVVEDASATIEAGPEPVVVDAPVAEEAPSPSEIDAPPEGEPAPESEAPAVEAAASEPQVADGSASEPATGEPVLQAGDAAKTAPLVTDVEPEELTSLPNNAVVQGKYVVQSQLHHGTDRNLYRVVARRQKKCVNCGRLSSVDADNCEHCGLPLANAESPADFYLMAESFFPQSLMQDSAVMDLRLYHPNIVPVVDYFNYTPFGRTRYYAVAEPRQGVRLSQLSMPRPALQVFNWALELADALDYLHSKGVIGAGAEADDILVQGDTAALASLQNAHVAADDSPERTQLQSMDLAKLAATMYEAYTGYPAAMSPEGMLAMPSQAPDKVAAAFRAALEPVQGIGQPISAAQWRAMLTQATTAIMDMEQPGKPVAFVASSLTDVGRHREQNQDSMSAAEFFQNSEERLMKLGLYVIADGMGGHKGGEIASAIAAQVFTSEVMAKVLSPLAAGTAARPAMSNEAVLQAMARAVQAANERIYKARDSRQNDMGTTLVAAVVSGGKAFIVNVGDSRLYLYSRKPSDTLEPSELEQVAAAVETPRSPARNTATLAPPEEQAPEAPARGDEFELTQVSVDHSLVHRLVELGQLDPEEAKVHPHRNFIYRSLGGPPPVDVDTFVRTLHPGDRLLLCSDGLNSMIEDSAIEQVLATEGDPDAACKRLIELANEAGGHDNITTILVDVRDYLPAPVADDPS